MESKSFLLSDIQLGAEEEAAVLRVLRSRWLSMGPEVKGLEAELATFLGAPHVLATSSCTTALHLALLALGVGPGDEVIVPALSFVATANAALYCGAEPVFADVESASRPWIDPKDVARRITPRTRAIIAMHYAGYPCDLDAIRAAAKDIPIVEDAAHCMGSRYRGEACGTVADIGCFSFFGNKNLPAGEGGALVTRDQGLYERATKQRSHGMTTLSWDRAKGHSSGYDVVSLGYNYRMPELSAAVARAQLAKVAAHNQRRDQVFDLYCKHLASVPFVAVMFGDTAGASPGSRHLLPVLVADRTRRADFMQRLRDRGVQSSIHYPPIYSFSYYRERTTRAWQCPFTEDIAARVVTLPFHPGLSDEDVATICSRVAEAA